MSDEENNNKIDGETKQSVENESTTEEENKSEEVGSESTETTESEASESEGTKSTGEDKKFTQEDLDRVVQREKAIARRRADREAQERVNSKPAQTNQLDTQYNPDVQPTTDHVWDNVVGWIPSEVANDSSKYRECVESEIRKQTSGGNSNHQNSNNDSGTKNNSATLSGECKNQIDKCIVDHKDAERILRSIPVGLDIVDYFARIDKKSGYGIENLYRLQKEDPDKLYELSRMSDPVEKQKAVVLLSQEMANKRKKKIKSNATPQPSPVTGNGGASMKNYHDMTYAEKKAAREK